MITIDEADYVTFRKIDNDRYYGLSLDIANGIIDDISDNVYNLANKLEALQKVLKTSGLDITDNITAIKLQIDNIFHSEKWFDIIDAANEL
jgi:hypothetical protein